MNVGIVVIIKTASWYDHECGHRRHHQNCELVRKSICQSFSSSLEKHPHQILDLSLYPWSSLSMTSPFGLPYLSPYPSWNSWNSFFSQETWKQTFWSFSSAQGILTQTFWSFSFCREIGTQTSWISLQEFWI